MARAMAGLGLPQDQIALLLEMDPKTLRKHLRDDLDRGMAEANVKIAQSLFNMATTGNNVAAAIFWMKARAGWREKHEVMVSANPLEQISDTELEQMVTILRDAIAEQTAIGGGSGIDLQNSEPTAIGPGVNNRTDTGPQGSAAQ